jgi:hypothetical protein
LWGKIGEKGALCAQEEEEGNPQRHEKSRPIPEQALSAGN